MLHVYLYMHINLYLRPYVYVVYTCKFLSINLFFACLKVLLERSIAPKKPEGTLMIWRRLVSLLTLEVNNPDDRPQNTSEMRSYSREGNTATLAATRRMSSMPQQIAHVVPLSAPSTSSTGAKLSSSTWRPRCVTSWRRIRVSSLLESLY